MPLYADPSPVGIFGTHGSDTPPSGWVTCDGSAISRTVYAKLFASIGIFWGPGDGSTTFNLPDLRGYHLRGWDNGAGNDPDAGTRFALNGGNAGDLVGSYQLDQVVSHEHGLPVTPSPWDSGGTSQTNVAVNTAPYTYTPSTYFGGNQTNEKNAYGLIMIKYV